MVEIRELSVDTIYVCDKCSHETGASGNCCKQKLRSQLITTVVLVGDVFDISSLVDQKFSTTASEETVEKIISISHNQKDAGEEPTSKKQMRNHLLRVSKLEKKERDEKIVEFWKEGGHESIAAFAKKFDVSYGIVYNAIQEYEKNELKQAKKDKEAKDNRKQIREMEKPIKKPNGVSKAEENPPTENEVISRSETDIGLLILDEIRSYNELKTTALNDALYGKLGIDPKEIKRSLRRLLDFGIVSTKYDVLILGKSHQIIAGINQAPSKWQEPLRDYFNDILELPKIVAR